MATSRDLGPESVLHYGEFCVMQTWRVGNGVVHSTVRGVQSADFAELVIAEGEAQIRRHKRVVFLVDARDSRQMTTEFRERMTAWFRAHKPEATVHMLLHSKLLEMALNLANLAIGAAAAKAYSSEAAWEAEARKEVPGFKGRKIEIPADLQGVIRI